MENFANGFIKVVITAIAAVLMIETACGCYDATPEPEESTDCDCGETVIPPEEPSFWETAIDSISRPAVAFPVLVFFPALVLCKTVHRKRKRRRLKHRRKGKSNFKFTVG